MPTFQPPASSLQPEQAQPTLSPLPPLAAYIHIPWCVKKCPYCDFNSHTSHDALPEAAYVDALIEDLEQDLQALDGLPARPLTSIFFGGGTPSLFSAAALDRFLQALNQRVPFADDIEITLEANPGTFEQAKFRDYRQAGINRLSIGIQSFNAEHLKALGRFMTTAKPSTRSRWHAAPASTT